MFEHDFLSNTTMVDSVKVRHSFVTNNVDLPGCKTIKKPWITNCNYDLAFEILKFTDNVSEKAERFNENRLFKFQQPDKFSFFKEGYAYVP